MRRGVLCGISRVCGLEGGLKTGGERTLIMGGSFFWNKERGGGVGSVKISSRQINGEK